MIQFNLLPDIKQQFVKVNRTKRMVIAISILLSAVVVVMFILLLVWDGLQKKNLDDINNDIGTSKSQLTSTPNLSKILTIQNQLNSLPALYNQNPAVSQLFGYLTQITPTTATISQLNTDFTQHTLSISGNADNLGTVNIFADSLKFATFSIAGQSSQNTLAFSDVVLSSFAVTDTGVTYTLTFTFNPDLFDVSDQVTLTVPAEVTTRSVTQQPDLFKKSTTSSTGGAN
jgi:hypothetical protein